MDQLDPLELLCPLFPLMFGPASLVYAALPIRSLALLLLTVAPLLPKPAWAEQPAYTRSAGEVSIPVADGFVVLRLSKMALCGSST